MSNSCHPNGQKLEGLPLGQVTVYASGGSTSSLPFSLINSLSIVYWESHRGRGGLRVLPPLPSPFICMLTKNPGPGFLMGSNPSGGGFDTISFCFFAFFCFGIFYIHCRGCLCAWQIPVIWYAARQRSTKWVNNHLSRVVWHIFHMN